MTGTGRLFVEWCETLWAELGGLGFITKYRTLLGRRIGLEHGAELRNQRQAKNLPRDLCSMLGAARSQHALSAARVAGDLAFLLMLGVTEAEVRRPLTWLHSSRPPCSSDLLLTRLSLLFPLQARQGLHQRELALATRQAPSVSVSSAAQYGRIRLQQEFRGAVGVARLPPVGVVFQNNDVKGLAAGPRVLQKEARHARDLELSLFGGRRPELDDPAVAACIREYAAAEIDRLQRDLVARAQAVSRQAFELCLRCLLTMMAWGLRSSLFGPHLPPCRCSC